MIRVSMPALTLLAIIAGTYIAGIVTVLVIRWLRK